MQYLGLDFGTSNSLASIVKDNQIRFVEYADNNVSNPTIIYFPTTSKQYQIGNEAIEFYLTQLENEERVGRLMLSIKTLLPESNFDSTMVMGHGRFTAEDLVARFLLKIKQLAENQFAQQFDGVVLGRPVNFSDLALTRLEKAAKQVGFKEVIFWLEPVAAALAHEITTTTEELVCVVDLGGGTSDICIIATSPKRTLLADRNDDIKAVTGVAEAGDVLSSSIMKTKLADKFGAGSTFKSLGKELPFPSHLIGKLSKWHRINLLKNSGDMNIISSILPFSNRPQDVERLWNLINNHYGFQLFGAIEQAKKELSENEKSVIKFSSLDLMEIIELQEFEIEIEPVVVKIKHSILEALNLASVKPDEISNVLLTGGTSQIPSINRMVNNIFGKEKVVHQNYFNSVATGLGYVASRFN